MPRKTQYNREGMILMGSAGMYAGIFGVPELSKRTGIPYRTAYHDVTDGFCGEGFERFRAYVKATGMPDEQILRIVKEGK